MSAYPAFPVQRAGSAAQRAGGQQVVRATNGAVRVRRLYSTEKTTFDLVHWLTDAQRTTLETFYQANRDGDVTLTWAEDGLAYTTRFAAPPQYLRREGWWEARVRLEQI
jgi:hypothetical protein